MVIKVLIAPLSTISFTTSDIIKLNDPRCVVFQGILVGLSFFLNFYLFAKMVSVRKLDSCYLRR